MNSSLMLHDPADAGIHTPNYVFVADQLQQRILCSNMASPHFVLTQESSEADLYQAYLNSPSFVLGPQKGLKLVNSLAGVSAILIDRTGKVRYSTDLVDPTMH